MSQGGKKMFGVPVEEGWRQLGSISKGGVAMNLNLAIALLISLAILWVINKKRGKGQKP